MPEQNFFDDFETPMQLVHARVVHVAVTKIQAQLRHQCPDKVLI